jgi:molybdopterin/thiamine biosynthesis adenylyltransferase
MNLESNIKKIAKNPTDSKPVLFNLSKAKDRNSLKNLIAKNKILTVIDEYDEQLKEYFEVSNPNIVFSANFQKSFSDFMVKVKTSKNILGKGLWAYFPWNHSLSHILPSQAFFTVRTARNRDLITQVEQKKFYSAVVGIGGLSVGNSIALAITLQGGAKHIKLADHDRLALSNTNRIRTSITNLGVLKVEMTARQIYELNPYAKVEIFSEGLNKNNIDHFCSNLDVIVDEVDNMAIKYLLRVQAKKRRIPVVMAADNGDNGIIDVERYDLDTKTKFFHNQLGDISFNKLNNLSKFETGKLITKLLGVKNVTPRMHSSLAEIGKTLVSWPQLGGAALLNGSAIAYCIRKIVNGQPLETKRTILSLDEKLQSDYFSKNQRTLRKKAVKDFKKIFKI